MITRRYFFQLLAICVSIIALALVLFSTVLKAYYLPVFPFLLAFVVGITLLEHWSLSLSVKKNPNRFNQVFMAASALKLLSILLMMVIYLLIDKSGIISFVIGVFILYVIFTFFEVNALLKLVQQKQDN